jgi:hypothetical protein
MCLAPVDDEGEHHLDACSARCCMLDWRSTWRQIPLDRQASNQASKQTAGGLIVRIEREHAENRPEPPPSPCNAPNRPPNGDTPPLPPLLEHINHQSPDAKMARQRSRTQESPERTSRLAKHSSGKRLPPPTPTQVVERSGAVRSLMANHRLKKSIKIPSQGGQGICSVRLLFRLSRLV